MRERTTKARIMNVIYWTMRVFYFIVIAIPLGYGMYNMVCFFITHGIPWPLLGVLAVIGAVIGAIVWIYTYADENRHERKGY